MKARLCALLLLSPMTLPAQARTPLATGIERITSRPEYRHSRWGMAFYSLREKRLIHSVNANQLFLPGSTGKMYPQATALATLGPDYRFRTKVYRTGPIVDGVLQGDLVLVASGDPHLSNRPQPDGTLAFRHPDHSYDQIKGAAPLPGNPLAVLLGIAEQVAAKGIKRIAGRVWVDASLFPERPWIVQAPFIVVSPIVVNDNIVDITVSPGDREGAPGVLKVSPETSYARFVNRTTTVAAAASGGFGFSEDAVDVHGTHTVTVSGSIPAGSAPLYHAYYVPEPTRYAAAALGEALRAKGIEARVDLVGAVDVATAAASYQPDRLVAEHVSAPLSETVKVTLKLSQNLHASMVLDQLGAIAGHDKTNSVLAGLTIERKLFESAGLELSGAVQNEGAGTSSQFTPAFTIGFLEFVSKQPYYRAFYDALPIMGRDGSLVETQVHSPAAGRVHAKTGTGAQPNGLGGNLLLEAKALAGYLDAPNGDTIAFAVYVNYVPIGSLAQILETSGPGEAIGEIVSLVYQSLAPVGRRSR